MNATQAAGWLLGASLAATWWAYDHSGLRGALASAVLAAAVAFWGSRLFAQLFVFDASLWRGRRATVLGHLALVAMWTYVTATFAWPLLRAW